ncbi:MAG: hypothetical protein JWN60_1274 [Acidobacteria bacterium]|nr:hypothetical protein [Acidobacteriota bacterium]
MNFFCILIMIATCSSFAFAQKPALATANEKSIEVLEISWKKAGRFNRQLDRHSTMLSTAPQKLNQIGENHPTLNAAKGYEYIVKIKNNGDKKIKSIQWSFDFIDPVSLEKIDTHQFRSEKELSAGKIRKLIEFSISPPTKIIDAALAEKAGENPYKEVITIDRIEYSDGSVWIRQ